MFPLLCRAVKGYRSCAGLREWSEGTHFHLGASRRHGSRESPMNGGCGTVRWRLIAGSFGLFLESRQGGCSHKSGFPLYEDGESCGSLSLFRSRKSILR